MNTYYVAGFPYSDSLFHHGIKGQEWGERNGPPYPLDQQEHSKKEQKAGWKTSLNKEDSKLGNWSDKHHLTKQQKAMIALGVAAVAAGGLAYYDYKTGKLSAAAMTINIKAGQSAVENQLKNMGYSREDLANPENIPDGAEKQVADLMDKTNVAYGVNAELIKNGTVDSGGKLSKLLQDRDLSTAFPDNPVESTSSLLEDARMVNPDFDPNNRRTSNNCGLCSMAFDLRRRGYNVFAGLSDTGTTRKDIEDLYPGAKRLKRFGNYDISAGVPQNPMSRTEASKLLSSFSKETGTRGLVLVSWGFTGGGHAMSYDVSNSGVVTIIDPQSGNVFSGKAAEKFLTTVASFDTFRTDNVVPNIEEMKKRHLIL